MTKYRWAIRSPSYKKKRKKKESPSLLVKDLYTACIKVASVRDKFGHLRAAGFYFSGRHLWIRGLWSLDDAWPDVQIDTIQERKTDEKNN